MTWVLFTLAGVLTQVSRVSLSKVLSKKLSRETVVFSRFLFALPCAAIIFFVPIYFFDETIFIKQPLHFFLWTSAYSISQVICAIIIIYLFNQKNFAVSIAYNKTDSIFVSLLAPVIIGEILPVLGWIGIIIAFVGFILISFSKEKINWKNFKNSFHHKNSYLGILSGLLSAIYLICIKKSFSYVETSSIFLKFSCPLFIGLLIQCVILLFYMIFKKKEQELIFIFKNPKAPFLIGFSSGMTSMLWRYAFSISYLAYVSILSQIEIILYILISYYFFKEKIYKNELIGIVIMIIGIIIITFNK